MIIDISGGELDWSTNVWTRTALPISVARGRYPILIVQPQNGRSLEPTFSLMTMAAAASLDYDAHIYPPIAEATDSSDAHVRFISMPSQVERWGNDALEFLAAHGIK